MVGAGSEFSNRWGGRRLYHIVQRGETLSKIALLHKTTVQQIVQDNGIKNPNRIRVGQKLLIAGANQTVESATQIKYTLNRKRIRLAWVNLHIFEVPYAIKRVIAANIPGHIRPSQQNGELIANGSFFWDGHPLGPTAINGVRYGYMMPNFHPLDLDTLTFVSSTDGKNVISAYPRLVINGVARHTPVEAYLLPRHPRTAMGWNKDTIFVVVADGRTPQSAGMTMQQIADYMKSLGCTEAINLDGGGSSIVVHNGKIVNRPSDGRERPVVTAIVFGGA